MTRPFTPTALAERWHCSTALHTVDDVAARLRELLAYDPETGEIRWRVDYGRKIKAGRLVQARNREGYIILGFNHKSYLAHRVALLLHTGQWPAVFVDHINGRRDDNRIANLRAANLSQSNANRRPTGPALKGVQRTRSGKWAARIEKASKKYHLGTFDTEEAANAAYAYAATKLHGDFARSK